MKNKLLNSIKNKMLQKLIVMSMLCIAYTLPSMSQSILEDTIWYRPQSYNVYNVKFLKNDQYIVVNGQYFFDTQTGKEFFKTNTEGSSEIYPFSNEEYFINLKTPSNKYYIYKTDGFQLLDTLEGKYDSLDYAYGDISTDNRFFVRYINNGQNLAIWDINSRKIVSKQNDKDTTLKNAERGVIAFSADNSKIFVHLTKDYYKGEDPKHNPLYLSTSNIVIFDAQTLDSIGAIYNVTSFRLSKDRKLMAISGYDKKDQIAILDLETMKVKQTINVALVPTSEFKFSDDNKYLVTAQGVSTNRLSFWDLETGKLIYYVKDISFEKFDLSKDNSKLVFSVENYLILLKTQLKVNGITNPIENQTTIYPNPVNQMATIEFASRIRNVEYAIVNQSGNVVKKSLFMANTDTINKMEIDFAIYPSGVYFVNLFTGNPIPQTIKIVKE